MLQTVAPGYFAAAVRARADTNAALILDEAERNGGAAADIAAAKHALDGTTYPWGICVADDLRDINAVHSAITGSELQRTVMKVKFYACVRMFSIMHGSTIDTQQSYSCRIWYCDGAGSATHTDVAKRDGDWYDSDGNVLQKWNGMHLHNVGGIMITSEPKIFRVTSQSVERYDMWVLYLPHQPARTGVAMPIAMPIASPVGASPVGAVAPTLTSNKGAGDKKRRAVSK